MVYMKGQLLSVGGQLSLHSFRLASSTDAKEIMRLKRRFLKDQKSRSLFFAKRELQKQQMREVCKDLNKVCCQ